MNTRLVSPRALRALITGTVAVAAGFLVSSSVASAASVTSWTRTVGTEANVSGLSSASPVLGTGSGNTGNGFQLYGVLPQVYTLGAVGDSLTFSGSAIFALSAGAGSDQFRFGVFDTNGSLDNNNWLGYFATNSGSGGNPNGRLWERKADHASAYFNNGTGSDERQASAGSPTSNLTVSAFQSGSYDFSLELTRTESGLNVAWSIVGTSLSYSVGSTIGYNDNSALTFDFDRVGFFTGGGLNANQVSFSGLDVTFVAVPEPATWASLAAASALAFACLRRRARA